MTHTLGPWAYDGVRVYAPELDEQHTLRRDNGTIVESTRLIALVYSCGEGSAGANGPLIAAAPTMFATLQAVWRLVETLDIGTAEKAQIRDLIYPAIDEARGPYPRVIDAVCSWCGGAHTGGPEFCGTSVVTP